VSCRALETILSLVRDHADLVAAHGRCLRTVPTIYWAHADPEHRLLNPLNDNPLKLRGESDRAEAEAEWRPWTPPKLVTREEPTSGFFYALPSTWFANEVGRAVVRATELGIEARSLVDRDTFRLLNTLHYSAQLFVKAFGRVKERDSQDREIPAYLPLEWEIPDYLPLEWGAGIMVRSLMELGRGVRHAPFDRADWYLEPCIRLANLSKGFPDWYTKSIHRPRTTHRPKATHPVASVRRLSEGAAACCLLVAEAIVDVLQRPDGPPPTERANAEPGVGRHAREVLRKQIEGLKLDAGAHRVPLRPTVPGCPAGPPADRAGAAEPARHAGLAANPPAGRTDSRSRNERGIAGG
jgi:hypothetical protein